MALNKFTKTEREKVKSIVAQLDRDGWTTRQISHKLHTMGMGVSQVMVVKYLQSIRKEYVKQQITSHDEKVEHKRHQLRDVIRRALQAWKWTTQEAVTSLAEKVLKKVHALNKLNLPIPTEMELSFGFIPQAEFLRVVMEALKLEAHLDGLTKEQQTTLINQVALDWSAMNTPLSAGGANEVDAKLAALEAQALGDTVPQGLPIGLKELPALGSNGVNQH